MILPEERAVGIEVFFSKHPGIGGRLRTIPEDFSVIEQTHPITPSSKGPFTQATVTVKNWETNHLIHELAQQLHISKKRIHFAGTKDKRAVTTQQMSFFRVPVEALHQINLKDVSITAITPTEKPLRIGNLLGNLFTIRIRAIDPKVTSQTIQELIKPLEAMNGCPNFFGIQRFGIIRPITHLVGKYIFQADFKRAVQTYLTFLSDTEQEDAYTARKTLLENNDYKHAFHHFPDYLGFEKILLQHLVEKPNDYTGALEKLPRNLLTMFIYAYQSYLFNRILSKRIEQGLPFDQAIVGDVVLPIQKNQIMEDQIDVTKSNLKKVNAQLQRGRGVVSSILPGSDTTYASGDMGEIEQQIIQEENVDLRDFIIPEIPAASSYGTRRSIIAPFQEFTFSISNDTMHPKQKMVTLQFSLRKGCYATVLLREIMKASDIRSY